MAIRNTGLGGVDWQDSGSSTLDGAIDSSVTTISLVDVSSLKASGIVLIDSEKIIYSGVSGNDLTGCTRGAYGSTAASHLTGATAKEIEILFTSDLNDTFDAVTSKIETLSAFWLNTDLYDVYDDFESSSSEIRVEIEATSVSSLGDFSINNCTLSVVSAGVWKLVSSSTSSEVQRAEIYKTLFYGTDGSNPRASSTYITGITALKTNVTKDVGKKAYYSKITQPTEIWSSSDDRSGYVDFAFDNTTTNLDCSVWSNLYAFSNSGTWGGVMTLDSVTLNSTPPLGGTVNEIGTDRSNDEVDNPSSVRLGVDGSIANGYQSSADLRMFFLYVGTLTRTFDNNTPGLTATEIDFNVDNSIPAFTAATNAAFPGDGSKWSLTGTGTIVASQNAGGTGNELRLSNGGYVDSTNLIPNRHAWARCKAVWEVTSGSSVETPTAGIRFGGTSYTVASYSGQQNVASGYAYFDLLVIAKGSDTYDVYSGGKKLASDVVDATPSIGFVVSDTLMTDYIYIDDVRQSKSTIS